ncbi:MAG: hypothetical protein K2Y21_09150 [Phycisphaerales bacterium]|nr:hypothetical protein [Phycisphaerales bacterium]
MDLLVFLLGPLFWIGRLYAALLLSDLWPQSWIRAVESISDRTSGWSWKGRLGAVTGILFGGIGLWVVAGVALTIALVRGWLSFVPAFLLATLCAYLLIGGSIAAVLILFKGIPKR